MRYLRRLLFFAVVCGWACGSFSPPVVRAESENAEVFDVGKGEVIRTLPYSERLQNQAIEWLSSAGGVPVAYRIEPTDGIAIRVPMVPPYRIQLKRVQGMVTEVVLFVGTADSYFPTLLIFTREGRPAAVYVQTRKLKAFLQETGVYRPELNLKTAP